MQRLSIIINVSFDDKIYSSRSLGSFPSDSGMTPSKWLFSKCLSFSKVKRKNRNFSQCSSSQGQNQ